MAFVASAKSNVMKSVIPAVKKCLLPSGRTGDSAASAMSLSLSTAAATAKYRPDEDDSSVQDDKQSRQACETRREGFHNIFRDLTRGGSRKPWDAMEDKEALHLRVDMPGLGKENVIVYAVGNTLVIKGDPSRMQSWTAAVGNVVAM